MNILDLPDEMQAHIASFLVPHAHMHAYTSSCKTIHKVVNSQLTYMCNIQLERMVRAFDARDPFPLDEKQTPERVTRRVFKACEAMRVAAAHVDQPRLLRELSAFEVCFQTPYGISGKITFEAPKPRVRLVYDGVSFELDPLLSEDGRSMYILAPRLAEDDDEEAHHLVFEWFCSMARLGRVHLEELVSSSDAREETPDYCVLFSKKLFDATSRLDVGQSTLQVMKTHAFCADGDELFMTESFRVFREWLLIECNHFTLPSYIVDTCLR